MTFTQGRLSFLLDELMPPKKNLPRMNRRGRFNIRHIVADYEKSGLPDEAVLRLAEKEKRILITADRDFAKRKRIQKRTAVVILTGGLTAAEMDERLLKVVRLYPRREDYQGKILSATETYVKEHDYLGHTRRRFYK